MSCTCTPNQWLKADPDCPEHGHEHCWHPWHTIPGRADCCICQCGSRHDSPEFTKMLERDLP